MECVGVLIKMSTTKQMDTLVTPTISTKMPLYGVKTTERNSLNLFFLPA